MITNIKTLEQTLQANEFAITAEIPAPISASAAEMEEKIDLLAVMFMPSMSLITLVQLHICQALLVAALYEIKGLILFFR